MRAAILGLVLFLPSISRGDDYLAIFSTDTTPYNPTTAHTFAAHVRVEKCADGKLRVVEFESMSWLPATPSMKVRAFALRSETGRNVPFDETLQVFFDSGAHICMWGPYRIQPELAETFKERVATVESSFRYKGACFTSPRHVCDCVRSIEEMVPTPRRYIGPYGYGWAAGSVVVQKFSPWLIEPECAHPEIATLIGLDEYPLVRRTYGDYTSKAVQFRASLRRR
jgi:hypothetical protein